MKPEDLIPGIWYDFRGSGTDAVAAKFTHCSGFKSNRKDYFHFSEFIRGTKHEFYNGSWSTADVKGIISLSEIEQYLPYKIQPHYEIY